MKYLNQEALLKLSPQEFQRTAPYPWAVIPQGLTDEGFRELRKNFPDLALFENSFGVKRRHGQRPHDKFSLDWQRNLDLPQPWQEFIGELSTREYKKILAKLLNVPAREVGIRFQWHVAIRGCSISPHCDGQSKVGSQLFYMNSNDDWNEAWGGQTLVLTSAKAIPERSAPELGEFDNIESAPFLGNNSFVFKKTHNSWHAVRELTCPEGAHRRMFSVIVDWRPLRARIKTWLGSGTSYEYV